MKGLILLYTSFEDVEALTPVDMLRRAKVDIDMVSMTGSKDVLSQSNIIIRADKLVEEINLSEYDFLIIPGGRAVMQYHLESEVTKQIVDYFMGKHALVAAICAGPSVLGKYDYLIGKEFTCFPSFDKFCNGAIYKPEKQVVKADNIITAKSAGAAFLFAYEILKYVKSEAIADHILDGVFYQR